jgi:cytochrome d ubiquinol oxidase subunit II
MSALQITWFFLIGVLLIGYAVLDGFDLGVGFWHLFTRKEEDRRKLLNSIGPVWDGNEVWLLTGGGAIFAAFPPVYATVFSGFYLAMMLLLAALIARAVAFEFRSKVEDPTWRKTWDIAFALGSIVVGLLLGVALGNILRGIPLDAQENYTGTFFDLLNPYALVVGLMGLAMLATHGGMYVTMKTEGELAERIQGLSLKSWIAYLVLFLAATGWTLAGQPHLVANYLATPLLFALPALALGSIVAIPLMSRKGNHGKAFIASSLSIALLMATAGFSLFPNLVPALNDASLSLTAENASSSETTLTVMFVIALLGMPVVIGYTIYIYRVFRGKVALEENSY